MPDASTTRISQEACGRIERDSLKAAAHYIRGRATTSGASTGEGSSFGLYSRHLFAWANDCDKVVSDSYISAREAAGIIAYKDEGAEHVVYLEEATQRAVKVTRPGLGDVLDYLESLDNSNELFGDDVSIVAVFYSEGFLRIIISQRWIVEPLA